MNILISGVGGQGVILASRVLAQCYLEKEKNIRTTETIGMAQMGGSVKSHLRVSDTEIYSPFVPTKGADIVLILNPKEVGGNLEYIGEKTEVVMAGELTNLDPKGVEYLEENIQNIYTMPVAEIIEKVPAKALNMSLLAFAIGLHVLDITKDEFLEIISENISSKFYETNKKAIEIGVKLGEQYGRKNTK